MIYSNFIANYMTYSNCKRKDITGIISRNKGPGYQDKHKQIKYLTVMGFKNS